MTYASPPRTMTQRLLALAVSGTNMTLFAVLVALLVVFGLLLGDRFFASATLQSMAFQMPELGILSLAMMVALLSGGLNLAIIATANLCGLTMAFILTKFIPGTEGALWVLWQVIAILAGFGVAAVIGLVNGFVIAYLRVSPILATLGTMTACKGIAIGMTHGNVISGFPDPIVFIGNGTVFGVPFALVVFALCALPVAVLLNRSPFGSKVYMIGSNEQATRYSGVATRQVLLKVYLLSSLLAAAAAVVMMARFNSANASYGESYLLVSILAAVLGGVDPFGGFGKVGGLVLALVILQVVSSAFNLLNFSQFLTLAIWGGILIAVTAVSFLRGVLRGS
ncbi:MAG: ABC transporter permease [Methylobacteriaceae bacterium]|nr:ABC transporter permease [Methylobacteriaceae bacterium]